LIGSWKSPHDSWNQHGCWNRRAKGLQVICPIADGEVGFSFNGLRHGEVPRLVADGNYYTTAESEDRVETTE